MPEEPVYTREQLWRFTGEGGLPIYIAYKGVVYDVTDCPRWQTGLHEGMHWPGLDLTDELGDAPHAEEVFRRPCVKRVGRLARRPAGEA